MVANDEVRAFWERHPVAAALIAAQPGTAEFFREFDAMREADDFIEANLIAGVKRSKIDAARSARFLSADEESRLQRALNDREERMRRERDSANAWRAARKYELLPDLRAGMFADYLKPLVLVSLHNSSPRRAVRVDLAERRPGGRPD